MAEFKAWHFSLLVALICLIGTLNASSITGYDVEVEYETFEMALEAANRLEKENPRVQLTGLFNRTVSMYTTDEKEAQKMRKRDTMVTIRSVVADYTGYYTYEAMTAKLREWSEEYPGVVKMSTLGRSVEGREIWCMALSMVEGGDETKPNVKYVGNMHGDEVVGRELLMRFLEKMITKHNSDPDVITLLAWMNIYVVPTMNPDGFARGTRGNRNGVDLNRNFPDQYRSTGGNEQQEVKIMKAFLASRQWTLSANFHGGDLVANYPWDGRPDNIYQGENKSPDDDTFKIISKGYASLNPGMMSNSQFRDGITNGAAWYVLFGGMQDFNYIHHGCLEITLEVSTLKWPRGDTLPFFWQQNEASLFNFLKFANTGVHGRVLDYTTGLPIPGVQVTSPGRDITKTKSSNSTGSFFRILPPGPFQLIFSKPGYITKTISVQVPSGFQHATHDVRMMVDDNWTPSSPSYVPSTSTNPSNPTSNPPHIISSPDIATPSPSTNQPPPSWNNPNYVPYSHSPLPYKAPHIPLISTSEGWVIPMFGVAGAFAAIALVLSLWAVFSFYGINIAGPVASSFGQLNSEPPA